jgi:uncharacterized membrane protein YfcA
VAYRLAEPRLALRRLRAGSALGLAAGFTSGITSTVAHAGGPPVGVYLLAARITPVAFVSTSALVFFVINWLKVPGYAAAGVLDRELLVALAPSALLIAPGVLAGRWIVHRLDRAVFERIVLVLLTAGAAYLLAG